MVHSNCIELVGKKVKIKNCMWVLNWFMLK